MLAGEEGINAQLQNDSEREEKGKTCDQTSTVFCESGRSCHQFKTRKLERVLSERASPARAKTEPAELRRFEGDADSPVPVEVAEDDAFETPWG